MNLRQLQYLISIHKEGSISKAAERLYISQPALSQQLAKLEEEIGTRIFDRSTTPMKLTYVGNQYMKTVERMVQEYEQVLNWIEDTNELKKGKIVIGIPDNRSVQVLPIVLPSFHEKYPHIEVELKEARGLLLPEMIEKGEIDFALMSAKTDSNTLIFIPIVDEEVLLAVPKKSSFNDVCQSEMKKHGYVDIALCRDEPFIMMKPGYRFYNIANQMFDKAGISPPVVMRTSNINLAHKMAGAGLGLTLVGQLATQLDRLTEIPNYYSIHAEKYRWNLGITYAPEKYITKAMQAFFNHFQEEMAEYGFYWEQE